MLKFLIDENLSPHIADYMRSFGYRAKAVRELNMKGASDEDIIQFSSKEGFIIVTSDIEFGEMFYRHLGKVSMVVLRSKLQRTDGFVDVLDYLHSLNVFNVIEAQNYLVLASIDRHRIRRFS